MQVKIDTRPLSIVILSRWWRFPVFALLNFALYYFYRQPPPDGLSVEGFRVLIVFVACIFLWVTQLLPSAGNRTLCPDGSFASWCRLT